MFLFPEVIKGEISISFFIASYTTISYTHIYRSGLENDLESTSTEAGSDNINSEQVLRFNVNE